MILPIRSQSVVDSGASKGVSFNYSGFDFETRIIVQRHTTEIKDLIRRTAQDIIDIGEKLLEVKEKLGHGNFEQWVSAEFGWSLRTANRFMQVTRQFKSANLADLNIAASALYHLAKPSTSEEARQEALERASQGEAITYATARAIVSRYQDQGNDESEQPVIDIRAEVIEDGTPATQLPTIEGHSQDEPEPPAQDSPAEKPQGGISKEQSSFATAKFVVGDRVRILRRQHGEDNWAGKTARIWQLTPDGWLRVDVEGHKGVRFTLKPNWVEPMLDLSPEQHNQQPEPVLDEDWADEPDPESPVVVSDRPWAIAEAPSEAESVAESHSQLQVGDFLSLVAPDEQDPKWKGEVVEVLEVSETEIKVVLRIPR